MPEVVWQPSREEIAQSQLTQFMTYINQKYSKQLKHYDEIHQFSIENLEAFWGSLAEFLNLNFHTPPEVLLERSEAMKDSKWFSGASLNYAEHCLNHPNDAIAIISLTEEGKRQSLTFGELRHLTAKAASALKTQGIKKGDCIAAIMPNCIETVVMLLAASSIGAVFSSCSPDFGAQGLLERFEQISPKLLISTNGYQYNQKVFTNDAKLKYLVDHISSIEKIVLVPFIEHTTQSNFSDKVVNWHTFLDVQESPLEFESCQFNHPLAILYSSGTTGKPKCIVHGTGGTLLQHFKELALHTNLTNSDCLFYYTTCGWMMWNWSVSGLLVGATIVLYDGNPMTPSNARLFDVCEQEKVSVFGTSAKYISAVEKEGLIPKDTHNLSALKAILSTGSPLSPVSFDYVYRDIKPDLMLASISGGTDIISCFALGCPIKPVVRGELQCVGLGMDVHILDDEGQDLIEKKGELTCHSPFPSMPVCFYNDPQGEKYKKAYFDNDPNIWSHGDFAKITASGGVIILGRSDAVLNPGGVRIGTAEIYRQVEKINEIVDSVVIGQNFNDDVRVILFVKLKKNLILTNELIDYIKQFIRKNTTPRHVPKLILQVRDIPKTVSGKTVELAVKNTVEGKNVTNLEAIANPEALKEFTNREELSISG